MFTFATLLVGFTLGLVFHPLVRKLVTTANSKHAQRKLNQAIRLAESKGYTVSRVEQTNDVTQDLWLDSRPVTPLSDADRISWQ